MAEKKGIIAVVSGFSGTGKGTLMKKLITEYSDYTLSVSMTTRAPREGEIDGREYFFTTDEHFEDLIRQDRFIEHAGYCGHYYGTPRDFVDQNLAAGKNVLLEIEVQGALQVKKIYPDALLIFVSAPSVEELKKRLNGRGTEDPETIARRIARAKEEAQYIDQYDHLLINDDLEKCTRLLHEIIQAAHTAPSRNQSFIQTIREDLDRE